MTTYRLLGSSGLRVFPLCLGTMLFGEAWRDRNQSTPYDECEKIILRYLELGGNFIDTSNFYQDGESEETIGLVLKSNDIPRHKYVLASKFSMPVLDGPNGGGNHKKNIVQSIDATLKRLRVDYLDVYYVHFWDFTVDVNFSLLSF
jgi:aryl-alcohol dehydrogenase-like predicted oxidoreductase